MIEGRPLLDGGLAVNNPDVLALIEVLRRYPSLLSTIEMLSIGRAGYTAPRSPRKVNRSAAGWAPDLPTFMMDVQQATAAIQARGLLGERYLRVNHPGADDDAFKKLDEVTDDAREQLLRAARDAAAAAYRDHAHFVDRVLNSCRG